MFFYVNVMVVGLPILDDTPCKKYCLNSMFSGKDEDVVIGCYIFWSCIVC